MERIGGILAIMGVVSAVLSFTTYELRLLFWIENWGDGVAWMIRVGLIIVGALLLLMAPPAPAQQPVRR